MKLVSFATVILLSLAAHATVDANDHVYLVAASVQEPEEFFIERAPIIGCYGLPYGARLVQFTMEYKVTSNIGCSSERIFHENINTLVCAKVVSSKESDDYLGFSEITLDISKCMYKNNPKFITMIRTAAKRNFPLKKGEVKLNLIK